MTTERDMDDEDFEEVPEDDRPELLLLLTHAERRWIEDGESALPVVDLMLQMGNKEGAATVARMALSQPGSRDAAAIERLLEAHESVPAGWHAAIAAFKSDPSDESWRSLIAFAGADEIYRWTRRAYRDLRKLGCDANEMIRYMSRSGITPDVMELVENGEVAPQTLIDRAHEEGAATSFWLGLAAEAAYLDGDRFRAVSLMRDAARANGGAYPFEAAAWLHDNGDAEFVEMLVASGIEHPFRGEE